MKKKERYAMGQFFVGISVYLLIYTYFYYSKFELLSEATGDWGISLFLSMSAIMAGLLIELGRFWGWVIEFKLDRDLLVFQGIPAAILSLVPGPLWLQAGGNVYPYIFFADPVVTGIAGVWFGIVLFRSIFNNKQINEDAKDKKV